MTARQTFAAVVFDIGGVLINWDPRHLYKKLIADEAQREWFLANVCNSAWNARPDAGCSFEEATAERIAAFPAWEPHIRAYHRRWIEMIGGPIPGTAAVVRRLVERHVRLFAISNFHAETFALIRGDYAELALFERIFLSGQHGCVKPDRRIFDIALAGIGIPARQLVFIDDSAPNVATAESLGMAGVGFT
ncbi:MAG: HAD-IA family hydrolase [Alphaproteobacteria bacterium]|nr:HAD-IA family hydrolase [Alphaproteobacteria bacterium]